MLTLFIKLKRLKEFLTFKEVSQDYFSSSLGKKMYIKIYKITGI